MLLRRLLITLGLAAVLGGPLGSWDATAGATGAIPGQYIVVLRPGADRAAAVAQARTVGGNVFMQYRYALNGFAARLPDAAVGALERNANVLFVESDEDVATTLSCDPMVAQCLPTGIDRIDADRSSTRSGDGRGSVAVNVAVIDTGIDSTHPDLNVVGGVSCASDKLGATIDPDGHGTEVAGVIGALDNGTGVVGVAPGARLWSARVLDGTGRGSISTMVCGIDWITSSRRDFDPSNDIAVANMSLGFMAKKQPADDGNCGNSNKDALHLAICTSAAAGITYVVAGGNSGTDLQTFAPASYDEVLTATAMTDFDGQPGGLASSTGSCVSPVNQGLVSDDSAAFFSNYATLLTDTAHTIAAPGVCIQTTASPGSSETPSSDRYVGDFSGTSASVPHVVGTVALCIASGPCRGLTSAQIIQKIVGDAAAYGTKHPDYGFLGDPFRPVSDAYYGYLTRAGLY